jgi:methylmalonyl-CoA/ethylmalonyl-CoA epimerase
VESLGDCVINIDHIAVAVTDLDKAIEWYTRCLGFSLLETRVTRGERTAMRSAVLSSGGALVVLVQGTTKDSQVSRFIEKFGAGVQHIAFSVQDLNVALDRVVQAGGAADTPLITDDGIRQVFLRRDAGSGVRIELIERHGGEFSDNTVEQLFRAFESRDLC